MEIRKTGRPGRPNDTEIDTAKEGITDDTKDGRITGPGKALETKTRQGQHVDTDESNRQNEQQSSHPAWNPDSRWSS